MSHLQTASVHFLTASSKVNRTVNALWIIEVLYTGISVRQTWTAGLLLKIRKFIELSKAI